MSPWTTGSAELGLAQVDGMKPLLYDLGLVNPGIMGTRWLGVRGTEIAQERSHTALSDGRADYRARMSPVIRQSSLQTF